VKKETLNDFLSRGGTIKRLPTQQPIKIAESIKPTQVAGPAVLMTLDEADLYYGEHKQRKAKKKSRPTIDLTALPLELRKKYVDDVIDVIREEENEESETEDEEE
jgi:hypothetical protein